MKYLLSMSTRDVNYKVLFEKEICKYLGVKYASLVSSGRKGLELILKYYNLPEKSEIIMPAYTLKDLPFMISNMGYNPVFVDVNSESCNIEPSFLEDRITDRTKVIIATHLFGIPCDIGSIVKIAKRRGLVVIEDCAHSLGAEYKGKKVGTFGNAGFFSLEVTKPINTFGGGIVATDDKNLHLFIENSIESYGYSRRKLVVKVFTSVLEDLIVHSPLYSLLGLLFYSEATKEIVSSLYRKAHGSVRAVDTKYTNFQAYLGYYALKNMDKKNSLFLEKISNMRKYLDRRISFPKVNYPCKLAFYFNLIKTPYDCREFRKKLIKEGIDAGIEDEVTDNCPLYFKGRGKYFPNTDNLYKRLIQIPLSYTFDDKMLSKIAYKINSVLAKCDEDKL